MNRKTKGALAMGAGAIILLGGAGSLALWSDTEDISASPITTGDFGLDCVDGAWTDASSTVNNGTEIDTAVDTMVPGDIWEYEATCTAVATGKNMKAVLNVTGITAGSPAYITVSTQVEGALVNAPVTFVQADSPQELDVKVKVVFDPTTPNTATTNTAVNVNSMQISLNQVRP